MSESAIETKEFLTNSEKEIRKILLTVGLSLLPSPNHRCIPCTRGVMYHHGLHEDVFCHSPREREGKKIEFFASVSVSHRAVFGERYCFVGGFVAVV